MMSILQREVNIAVLDRCGFQTCFGSAASVFENIELPYIHCALKEISSLLLRVLHVFHKSVENYLCARSQLQTRTKNETRQLIRFTRRTETLTDLKSSSNKTAATM